MRDCVRIINPKLVEGQVYGGIAQDVGQALTESILYSPEGQPLTSSLIDYALPFADELVLDTIETPSPLNPLGAKGIGELPTVAASVAVANAIMERKNHNITRTPQYLHHQKGIKTAPVAKAGGLVRFLQWFNDNGADINLRKMSPPTLAAFGLVHQ